MILPNKDRKTAAVSIILKRLGGKDYDDMREKNSEYMENPARMAEEREDMEQHENQELAPLAHKIMMAISQKDENAFVSYLSDLVRKLK